jgi:hypothetical protein
MNLAAGRLVIRQLHHVIKVFFAAADVEDVHLALVLARNRFELLDAFELALERPIPIERTAVNDLHGPEGASDTPRQPDLAVGATPNPSDQFVIRYPRWGLRRGGVGGGDWRCGAHGPGRSCFRIRRCNCR